MSHKHLFSLRGHSVTSDIGGGDIVKEILVFFEIFKLLSEKNVVEPC